MKMLKNKEGFTIVELLIVIVVIGILAAITIVAYNGVQDRAKQSKINSDLAQIEKAIITARTLTGTPLYKITNSTYTAAACASLPNGTDLSDKTVAADCWGNYMNALNKISTASGVNITNMADPWNRPYVIDENEDVGSGTCSHDQLGTYKLPSVSGSIGQDRTVSVPFSLANC